MGEGASKPASAPTQPHPKATRESGICLPANESAIAPLTATRSVSPAPRRRSGRSRCPILGLLGRIGKQRYVAAGNPRDPRYRAQLPAAAREYLQGYQANPKTHYRHGINAVALIARARRDAVTLENVREADEVVRSVLGGPASRRDPTTQSQPWELATILEARIALGDHEGAEAAALDYAACAEADAFEYASTLRQLIEVWGLSDGAPPGSRLLPILRAALLRREGGRVQLTAGGAQADLTEILGAERFRSLGWYQSGLERRRSRASRRRPGPDTAPAG